MLNEALAIIMNYRQGALIIFGLGILFAVQWRIAWPAIKAEINHLRRKGS